MTPGYKCRISLANFFSTAEWLKTLAEYSLCKQMARSGDYPSIGVCCALAPWRAAMLLGSWERTLKSNTPPSATYWGNTLSYRVMSNSRDTLTSITLLDQLSTIARDAVKGTSMLGISGFGADANK